MSTSSTPRNRAPAHQNKFGFRHNKNSRLSRQLATVTTGGLCARCADKIEWRKKYRKYKPLTVPRKCNYCGEKKVKAAYRTICPECALARKQCEQCAEEKEVSSHVNTPAEAAHENDAVERFVKGMSERQKRTILRRVERGEDILDIINEVGNAGDDESIESDDEVEDGDEHGAE